MKRSKLRNKFLKGRTENNQKNFKLERDFCKKLLRTTKKFYYNNLDIKKIIIPLFTKRHLEGKKINY